ncbi:hypothetical protein ZWY2020_046479 [Hordeum vulgare]|nr:hypothetical protein ZWY2020_046479 [Hordeum vulgare]
MVDFLRFEAHPVDLPDAAEMPRDAGRVAARMEIRFHEEVTGPERRRLSIAGHTGVVGRVSSSSPKTTRGVRKAPDHGDDGLPPRPPRARPFALLPSTILGRALPSSTSSTRQGHCHRPRCSSATPKNTPPPFLQELLAASHSGLTRLVWSFWTDDKAGVSS